VRRNVGAALVQLVAGVLLVVAATTMPWSMYTSIVPKSTSGYHSGVLGALLAGLGLAAIVVALRSFAHASKRLQQGQIVIGATAGVISIVIALRKISAANHFLRMGGGHTSYAAGAVVAVLASAAVAVTGWIALANMKPSRT
jgi:hypothetical protein